MARKLQLRRGTAAQWTAANPVLAQGEPGFEYDTGKLKYGDGATAWNSLTYAGGSGAAITALSALTPAANKVPYFTGASTAAMVDSTSYGRALLNVADEAALKALINAEGGVDFATHSALTSGLAGKQDLNSRLTGISNMASLAVGDLVQWDGTNFVRLAPGTSGHFLKSNGAGVAPSYAAVEQTGRWVFLEKQEPTSDATSITFSTNISAYKAIRINSVALFNTSGAFFFLDIGPGGGTWRNVGLGSTTTGAAIAWDCWEVWNIDNSDGSNFRSCFALAGYNKSGTFDRSSNTLTSQSTQLSTGGYSSYTETITSVRLNVSSGNIEGSNADQRSIATLWGLT